MCVTTLSVCEINPTCFLELGQKIPERDWSASEGYTKDKKLIGRWKQKDGNKVNDGVD